jgi:protein-arginine kinase activator protein McsA
MILQTKSHVSVPRFEEIMPSTDSSSEESEESEEIQEEETCEECGGTFPSYIMSEHIGACFGVSSITPV